MQEQSKIKVIKDKIGDKKFSKWREICNRFNIPYNFILPTERYFTSKKKSRPNLEKRFFKKITSPKLLKEIKIEKPNPKLKFSVKYPYVKFNDEFKKLFLERLLQETGTIKNLSEILKTNYNSLTNYFGNYDFIPFELIEKFCELLKGDSRFSIDNVVKNIDEGKSWRRDPIIKPKFFVDLSSIEGVRLRMRLRGDGWIDKYGRIWYSNQDENLLTSFCDDLETLFGRIKNWDKNGPKIKLPEFISRILLDNLNYSRGSGVMRNVRIDKDILNGSKKVKTEALKVYFGDEGRFHSNSIEIVRSLDIIPGTFGDMKEVRKNPKKYAPTFLWDIRKILGDIGVDCSKPFFYSGDVLVHIDSNDYLRLSIGWRLRIWGERNIRIFLEECGFGTPLKDKKVKKYLEGVKIHKVRKGKMLEFAYKNMKKVQNKYGIITVPLLSKESKRSIRHIRRWIKIFVKKGKLVTIKENNIKKDKKGRIVAKEPNEYKLKG